MKNTYHILLSIIISLAVPSVHAQTITTCAGNGFQGYTGDNVPASTAALSAPMATAVDDSGNVYIADYWNYRVRKVSPSGIITTVAGNGTAAYTGDGGPATSASLYGPWCLALDKKHNLYIADINNQRIRKVDTAGIITTIAGNGTGGYSGDGGSATQAEINWPQGLAVDDAGNVYIGEAYNNCIRKVDASGIISTLAGTTDAGYSGDGGPATAAKLHSPGAIAIDPAGNIYFTDFSNAAIRKVDANGIITTVAGNGLNGSAGDGGPAVSAYLTLPWGIAIDNNGNLYIGGGSNTIRKVDNAGIINTIAGTGQFGYSGDGGPALSAAIYNIGGIAVSPLNDIYIASYGDNRVRKISGISGRASLCMGDTSTLYEETPGGTWMSANTGIATVDALTGKLTAVAIGNTIVYYGLNSDTTSTPVIVSDAAPVIDSIIGPSDLCAGGAAYMSIASPGGIWSITNANAYIDAYGRLSPMLAGIDTIVYTITNGCGTVSTQKTINIISANAGNIFGLNSICPGDTLTFTDAVIGGTWSHTNPGVITLQASGFAQALAPGADTITYTISSIACGNVVASYPVTVRAAAECQNAVNTINNEAGISVYPNPSNGNITIAIPKAQAGVWHASLYDLYGRMLMLKDLPVGAGKAALELTTLAKGTYLLKLQNGADYKTQKIVIE